MAKRYIWFWSFWHWSRESHRAGMLLKPPLEGIASHWDEWYLHEASARERLEIDRLGASEPAQRALLDWLRQRWSEEALPHRNAQVAGHVLRELSQVRPFADWPVLVSAVAAERPAQIAALVLGRATTGEAADVRRVEVTLLPADPDGPAGDVHAEDFQAESGELETVREAVLGLLGGKQRWSLLWRWLLTGQRTYPRWLAVILNLGWLAVAGLLSWLLAGPDPGERLPTVCALLAGLWFALVITALGAGAWAARRFFHTGARLAAAFGRAHVRLRLPGRLTLKGGSAGLAFGLSMLLAVRRAYPDLGDRSWLWHRMLARLDTDAAGWAATGVLTAFGEVRRVEVDAKLQACRAHGEIGQVLAPRQREAGVPPGDAAPATGAGPRPERAEPAANDRLRVHRCRTFAGALLRVAGLRSSAQTAMNAAALAISAIMIWSLPDLFSIVVPPAPPPVVAPASPSPYFLWVSLDTTRPDFFQVVLESRVWVNRRVDVNLDNTAPASVRAEIRLVRRTEASERDFEDGLVWIERRPCFLNRKFEPGERVGRYTVSYINRLRHD